MNIQPFTIHLAQSILDDLRQRLSRTRWPDEVEEAGWDDGADLTYMRELVAWWHSRFDWQSWSDCSGDVERRFSKDDLLTVVTLYWVTQTIGSSLRIYKEWALASALTSGGREVHPEAPAGADATASGPGERIEVPCAIALPRGDNKPPREWAERAYKLWCWTEMPRGGHFLAFEEPELLARELSTFFRPLRLER
jgi:pimeloyl-ACP methyl ester carboxylesterase